MEIHTDSSHIDFENREFLFDVVNRCQGGDAKAMETVYTHYKSSLFNLAYRFSKNHASAEDLLQEIFIKIFTQIDKLRSPEALKSWLYRIAVNTCVSHTRKKAQSKEISLDDVNEMDGSKEDPSFLGKSLERAITFLPPKQKAIFLLHDVQGFTHDEIAGIMKLRQGTSKSQLFKARMKLRELLTE